VFLNTRRVYIRYKRLRGSVVVLNPGGVITDSTTYSLRDRLANPGDFSYRIPDSPDHSLEALGILRGSSD
jgi:hypothetical protein